ncbi:ATP-dependent DNA helicase PIF1-like [Hibiscus syriacus]|uniref:ATP-dependent DNA helicase PIF1-like n=1 Tax=Hibiscus syriacus TaxID=106335 RepID=A0A6A3AA48_HIBSY|nr:ATP-dependent DNA helicase PIF1-like [Hibiscus syriacus]
MLLESTTEAGIKDCLRVYISRHVQFFEDYFPYASNSTLPSLDGVDYVTFDDPSDSFLPNNTSSSMTSAPRPTPTLCVPCADSSILSPPPEDSPQPSSSMIVLEVIPHVPSSSSQLPTTTHPMVTRAKNDFVKPRTIHSLRTLSAPTWFQVHLAVKEPRGFTSAVKHPEWLSAMDDEIDALKHNNTWRLVSRPTDHNVVGFPQKHGIDFNDTFSPVVSPVTVRIILSIAAMHGWSLHQFDVKNAFLHGFLTEERFSQFLLGLGFIASLADSSLFVYHGPHGVIYLLLYVDDMVITDWASCPVTRRSTIGYVVYFGQSLILWCSKKQTTVALSSVEAEYRALASVAVELSWTLQLLRELHITLPSPPRLLCDNQSAIFMASNPVTKSRSKHIDIDYHFVRELVARRVLSLGFVPSHLQLADVFTKGVPKLQFLLDCSKLCVFPISPTPTLRGILEENPLPLIVTKKLVDST